MSTLIGKEYCTVDANGRFKFPTALKKQLISELEEGFVIRESIFDPCLELYTLNEWEKVLEKVKKLNPNNIKHRPLIRKFSEGNKITLDNNDRLLIPGDLKKAKNIDKDIVLIPCLNCIEVWNTDKYNDHEQNSNINFPELANELLGNIDFE